ncbi:phosphatidylinositol glycan anchor biosynthesis class U protein [Diorhabda carinulata]|uniref:phosphatidylinositol glycan anchor biosynthesis class U protein n=1 Tax=Diorhabda carinulata TaxID=1163345 RepID=UPI0025A0A44E|nr:phosphatidylinositol glycan anchor biosynthesis class U protein [Diorhabda carinulata]
MSLKKHNFVQTNSVSLSRIISTCLAAIMLRYYLMLSKYQAVIANHVEVSTPLNSWKRVSEGLYLLSLKINPYEGDVLHETPLSLFMYKKILQIFQGKVHLVFIKFDILTAIILYFAIKRYVLEVYNEEERNKHTYAKDAVDSFLRPEKIFKTPYYVLLAYLFNPYTILNSVGYSTTVFYNFYLSCVLFTMVNGLPLLCGIFLAKTASISFYSLVLLLPGVIYFNHIFKSVKMCVICVVSFVISSLVIVLMCSDYGKDFSYFRSVYGCILNVPDLQPNIGLFWYFFTEMFEHFRELFIYAFQINTTILYLVPISIKFRNQPFLLIIAINFIITIFKSYPSVGDVGFVLSIMPAFPHIFEFSQQGFLVGTMLIITTCLGPIVYYLWIYCNSANANFYFGVTLAFAVAQIFLLTDLLFSQVKREYMLKYGKDRKVDGDEGNLCLE